MKSTNIIIGITSSALLLAGVAYAPAATADPFCSSFSLYSYCVEVPSYTTPVPVPLKALPKWVCQAVSYSSIAVAWYPTTSVLTIIARVLTVPSTICTLVS